MILMLENQDTDLADCSWDELPLALRGHLAPTPLPDATLSTVPNGYQHAAHQLVAQQQRAVRRQRRRWLLALALVALLLIALASVAAYRF